MGRCSGSEREGSRHQISEEKGKKNRNKQVGKGESFVAARKEIKKKVWEKAARHSWQRKKNPATKGSFPPGGREAHRPALAEGKHGLVRKKGWETKIRGENPILCKRK